MKNNVGLLAVMFVMLVGSMPVYAAVEGSSTGATKPISFVEFKTLPGNYGVPEKALNKRYEDYRKGRLPIATLDVSRMR